jgi:hypothetical protein
MAERNVACLLIRNCPARGSHTRPSLLERSDHFETIAASSLYLSPDPMQPNHLLLSHANSHASALASTLTLQIQPIPHAPKLAKLALLGSHTLKASDLLEHRPDTLHRQILAKNLLSCINASPTPIPVPTLYANTPASSLFQVQRALKDLLNMGLIERPSRGLYAPLTTQGATPAETPDSDEVCAEGETAPTNTNATSAETVKTLLNQQYKLIDATLTNLELQNGLKGKDTAKAEMRLANKINLIEDNLAKLLPEAKLNEIAPIPPHPEPPNELTKVTPTILAEEDTPNLTEVATIIPTKEEPHNLTKGAATIPIEEEIKSFTEGAAIIPTKEETNNLTEVATTTPTKEETNNLTAGAAITTAEEAMPTAVDGSLEPPSEGTHLAVAAGSPRLPFNYNLTEVATITPTEEETNNLTAVATTTPNESSANGFRDIAEVLIDPAFVARLREVLRTAHDTMHDTVHSTAIYHDLHSIGSILNAPHLASDIAQLQEFSPTTPNHSLEKRPEDMVEVLLDPALVARLKDLFAAGPKSLDIYTIRDMAFIISSPFFCTELKKLLQSSPPPC